MSLLTPKISLLEILIVASIISVLIAFNVQDNIESGVSDYDYERYVQHSYGYPLECVNYSEGHRPWIIYGPLCVNLVFGLLVCMYAILCVRLYNRQIKKTLATQSVPHYRVFMGINKLDWTIAAIGLVIVLVVNLIPSHNKLNMSSRNFVYDSTSFGFPKPFVVFRDVPFYDDLGSGEYDSASTAKNRIEIDWSGASIDIIVGVVFVVLWTFLISVGINVFRKKKPEPRKV